MNETMREINEAGFCIIEVENYGGSGMVTYLINLRDKTIEKKDIYPGCEKYDIINEVTSSDIEEFVESFPGFGVADIDDDYIYETDYLLVRLQED